jgi:predicted permease
MSIDQFVRIAALRFRSLFRRDEVEQELDEELQYHVERQTAENVRLGMPPDIARAAALRDLGNVGYRKEQVRDTRGTRWIEEIAGDLRFAARSLRRARGFTATVIVTLALGIGANTAMFTLLRGTLLRALPNRDGNRLIYLRQEAPGAQRHDLLFSVPEVQDYRAAKTLTSLAEYSSAVPFTLVDKAGQTQRVKVGVVTGNYFEVMGLDPVLGRLFNAHDDGPAAAPVAVLSHEYWMKHFGGDSRAVGTTIRLNDMATTIVGVAEPAPPYPKPTDFFVNTAASPHNLSATMVTGRTHRMSDLFARLAPNVTVDQARQELARISSAMFHDHPEAYEKAARFEVAVLPLRKALNERASLTFWLLMAAAGFVLLIAFANVSNLTLMRGVGREREMQVRAALGAGRLRLRRLLVAENLALTIIGGALGVLVAFGAVRLLVAFAAQFTPRASEIRVDATVLVVSLVTSIAVAIALSFVPRIGGQGERGLASSLAPTAGGRRVTLGRARQRFQQSLVVVQIAVCVVLLTGAGLLVRTLSKLEAVDSGVHVDHVLTLNIPLQGELMKAVMNQPANLARYERIRERVAALPGVDMAALGAAAPLRPAMLDMDLRAEGRALGPNQATPHASYKTVDTKYFAAAGIPLRAGRGFETTDQRGTPLVAILNESFAKQLFGDENPVGRHISPTGPALKYSPFTEEWRTVVGIVGDTRDKGLEGGPTPTWYEPFAQALIINGTLVVRTSSDPAIVQPMVVQAVHETAPGQLIERVATMAQIRDESVAPRRLNAMFIAAFGLLAFLIAMVGIAGVLAFSVSSRTAEIGIRMSLGADAGRVRRMILGEGGGLLVVGIVIGSAGAWFAARILRGLLFGVTPHDPTTLAGVALGLAAVGVVACWLPAARAARVDPAVALRAE